jgi:hypothetical protein
MRQDRSQIGKSGYPGYPRVTQVIARLSRLPYHVIWVILSSYQPNKPKLR